MEETVEMNFQTTHFANQMVNKLLYRVHIFVNLTDVRASPAVNLTVRHWMWHLLLKWFLGFVVSDINLEIKYV